MNTLSWVVIVAITAAAFAAAGHAVLYKRDPRAAFGWVAVCLMFPLAGPVLYFFFGINRIHTRARKLHRVAPFRVNLGYERTDTATDSPLAHEELDRDFGDIARVSDAVTRRSLVGGNSLEVLENGERAYPAMLESIEAAQESVYLCTYIFQLDNIGNRFVEALHRATLRGVDVRVIVDGIGELYSFPRTAGKRMRELGIPMARFLPPTLIPPTLYLNLRTHRKLLICDGRVGYTGGMNIADRHLVHYQGNRSPVHDVQFRLGGPVVAQMQADFLEDWRFCIGESPPTERVDPTPRADAVAGDAVCRVIADGPNEDLDKLAAIMLGAVSAARKRVGIVTPYFLPSREMISALQTAVLRGVKVDLVLPSRNNLPYVHWATQNMLWEVVQRGVGVYYQPPPFDHSKLFLIDDFYAQIGSANLDPRSLRLNFELAVEVFDRQFSSALWTRFERMRSEARRVTLEELDARPLWVRARDAVAWLFSPYL